MRKLLIGSIISGFLAALPLMALPGPAVSNTPLLVNVTSAVASSTIDVSRMVNGAVQICSTDAPGATVVDVEIRMGTTFNWYIAARLTAVPLCSGAPAYPPVGYYTLPLATQMRVEVSSYATGHIFANYGERTF